MEILPFLLAPLLASLILTGIHAYLGVHVVERGVIFVDLALAQIAALGATIAILIGMSPHGTGAYWLSLGFTFAGAAIFTFARTRRSHIPLEAFIGIAYAVASAIAILAMSKATGETEHLKDMLVGNILAVSMHDVLKTAALYGAIGLFHYIFRRQFLLISTNPSGSPRDGHQYSIMGFSFLRILRICGDIVGCNCRRSAGVLLSRGPIRGRHAVCRQHREASCNRLDHGNAGISTGSLFFGAAGPAHGCDYCGNVRRGIDCDVLHTSLVFPRTQDLSP